MRKVFSKKLLTENFFIFYSFTSDRWKEYRHRRSSALTLKGVVLVGDRPLDVLFQREGDNVNGLANERDRNGTRTNRR